MRKMFPALFAGLLLPVIIRPASSQTIPPRLTRVAEALACIKKERMSGWSIEHAPPISGGENVLIQFWASGGRRVKVSILPHQSEVAAVDAIRRFVSGGTSKRLEGFGDEAYAWGYG